MKIAIGSDHAGLILKRAIINHYKDIHFIDVGTDSAESCDYPDFAYKVGEKIQKKEVDRGIAICGTGIGASIAINKMKGIRAALCLNSFMAEMSIRHNNANVLVLGARVTGEDLAYDIIDRWLKAEFEGGRHQRRLDKISEIEKVESAK